MAIVITPDENRRRLLPQGLMQYRELFFALVRRDLKVRYKQTVVGMVGRDGTGKGSLLKILSWITSPTQARAEFDGRITLLLEVGTGFHPELTSHPNPGLALGVRTGSRIRRGRSGQPAADERSGPGSRHCASKRSRA